MIKSSKPKYLGIRITTNSKQLFSFYTEARITEAEVFYPITPSTGIGEMYEFARTTPLKSTKALKALLSKVDNGEISVADLKA